MTYHAPHYYSTGGMVPGERTLVHVRANGDVTTMQYDEELSTPDAIERMQQQERDLKHFDAENAANRKKVN